MNSLLQSLTELWQCLRVARVSGPSVVCGMWLVRRRDDTWRLGTDLYSRVLIAELHTDCFKAA